MTALPPLPPPHATSFYANPLFSDDQMRAYAAQAVAAERERLTGLLRTAEGWLRDAGMLDEAEQIEALTEK